MGKMAAHHQVVRGSREALADRALETRVDAPHVHGRRVQDPAVLVARVNRQVLRRGGTRALAVVERRRAAQAACE